MRRMWRFTLGDEHGMIFIGSLVLVTIMVILGVALFTLSMNEGALAVGDAGSNQLLYCAEAALGRTINEVTALTGRAVPISTALVNMTPVTFTETVTVTPPVVTCSNRVDFTPLSSATGYLQATATAPCVTAGTCVASYPNNTQRSVRIQLQGLSFQFWNPPPGDPTNPNNLNQNGAPYWDRVSYEGGNFNIGDWMANSGAFAGSTAGPGAIAFWGQSYNKTTDPAPGILPGLTANTGDYCAGTGVGCANSNIIFNGTGGTVTLTAKFTATSVNQFGWFESDASGTIGTTHQLFDTSVCSIGSPCATVNFCVGSSCPTPTATQYYGFYMKNVDRNVIYYSLAGKSAAAGNQGDQFWPSPTDCLTCANPGPASANSYMCTSPGCPSNSALSPITYQHFAIFKQPITPQNPLPTYWFAIEDGWYKGKGNKCNVCNTAPCPPNPLSPDSTTHWYACIDRTTVDEDYQDLIIKVTVPNGDTVMDPAVGPRLWKNWQECVKAGTPPAC